MKKASILFAVLLCAAPAWAQDGSLYQTWTNCQGEAGAVDNLTFDCAGGNRCVVLRDVPAHERREQRRGRERGRRC